MMFDFDHDGELSFGEAMSAAGIIGAYADEVIRDSEKSEKSERKSSGSPWYDDDDDDDDNDDDWPTKGWA